MNTEPGRSPSTDPLAAIQARHRGRSWVEGCKVVAIIGAAFAAFLLLVLLAVPENALPIGTIAGLAFIVGAAFVLYFFRDAQARPPHDPGVILSPAHGTVDYLDITTETHFLNGPARRVSICLSLLNVHVQHAPVSGRVEVLQHFPGRWSRAIRRESSLQNEHLLVGLASADGQRIALRMISGIWVRRIVPWITPGERVAVGERIGLIRFGSRVDVFLPLSAHVQVKAGDQVRGGETILARFETESGTGPG